MNARFTVVCAVLLSACASLPEQQEAREYRAFEWADSYQQYRRECRRTGGVIVITSSTGRFTRNGIPDYGDSYRCQQSGVYRR
jgi:starvation-inducible outer membrane lipoprotein